MEDVIDLGRLNEVKYLVSVLLFRGTKIILVLLLAWVFIRLMKVVSRRIVAMAQDDDPTTMSDREKNAETIAHVVNAVSKIFAVTISFFMILRELGFNITPLLTGAGIAGVAIGLGAQAIVRDFLAGFFILMENQIRVGDVIRTEGADGQVVRISLRTTHLRDADGILHIIPNGEIKTVRNMTYGWSRVRLDIGVPYEADLERALAVLRRVGEELRADPVHGKSILDAPEVLGVENFTESQVVVRVTARTQPQKQFEVAREYRRLIRAAFEREGIGAPYPRQVVIERRDEGRAR
jgi:small-conductance mechanosensitive channel